MTDFKQKLRGFFSDSSLFRRIYIIDLFFTNIAFLQIPAYVLLVFLFIWGVCLSVYNQRHNNTFFKLRFGIWIGAFLAVTVFSMLINFSQTFLYSLLMLLHVGSRRCNKEDQFEGALCRGHFQYRCNVYCARCLNVGS